MITKPAEARLAKMVMGLADTNHTALLSLLEGDEKLAMFCMSRRDLRNIGDASVRILSQELVRMWEPAALAAVMDPEIAAETNHIGKKFGSPVIVSAVRSWESAGLKLLEYPERAMMVNELAGRMVVFDAVRHASVARAVATSHKDYLSLRSGFVEISLRQHIKDIHGGSFLRSGSVPSIISSENARAIQELARGV